MLRQSSSSTKKTLLDAALSPRYVWWMQLIAHRIPIWIKIFFTAFMIIMIPVYWINYGPTNFLYFCDVSMILTLIAVWTESSLLVSMCAVGILAPQFFWVIDFLLTAVGIPSTGMTAYMFQADHSLFLRSISLFHGWLPFLLVYLVYKLGYDRRALFSWTFLSWVLILISYFFLPPPQENPGLVPVNVNYVWGLSDTVAQTWVSPTAWLAILMFGLLILFFIPTHLLLVKFIPKQK